MPRQKRALKRSRPTEEEPQESTFINNSDYITPDRTSEDDEQNTNHQASLNLDSALKDEIIEDEAMEDVNSESTPQDHLIENSKSMMNNNESNASPELSNIPHPASGNLLSPSPGASVSETSMNAASTSEPAPQKSRLVISQLVLTNFKSYAGQQVIGPFNASFSAVVGPNGSGKSNVIDSMLFVFGFRALKMRQGKLSELIHNSAGGEKLDFCQVDIHFNHVIDSNDDPVVSTVVPNSLLVISRKAYKNNSSQYYINGKGSNYTEVTSFLKDQGIDLDHKRFLILQGEVEQIAQMKAKAEKENDDGLLEYLEDIIGTSKYKSLIEENTTKADELNDVCIEKENRFELVEKDKELMEEKKNEALSFLAKEKLLISKKSIQYQTNIQEHQKKLNDVEAKREELEEQLKAEKEGNKELTDKIEECSKLQKEISRVIDELSNQLNSLLKRSKAVNKVYVSGDEKIKNMTNKIKKAAKNQQSLKLVLSTSTSKLEESNKNMEDLKDELSQLTKNLESEKHVLDEIRRRLTDKTSVFAKQIEAIQTKLEPWNDQLKEKESEIQLVTSSIDMLQKEKENALNQIEEYKQKLINIKTEGKEKEQELINARQKLDQISEQIQLGQSACEVEQKSLESKQSQLLAVRQQTQEAITSLSSHKNKSKVLTSLVRLAKSGRIDGFYGRLGDLGTINDRYDVAISTVCPGLDSMVVETVETAQACIDYLRKNKLGYATFICLNKLRNFNLDPISVPPNLKRLFDMITPQDQKFAPAFYSKLYNTLVTSTLLEAKQVAYGAKRWKVVTLDGKVVDTSGTMSGGGTVSAKGAMKLESAKKSTQADVTEEEVEELRNKLQVLEGEFDKARSELKEKQINLRKLQDLKPETEFSISRLELDIQSLVAEKKDILRICKNLISEHEKSEQSSDAERELNSKLAKRKLLEEERDQLKSQMASMEAEVTMLEEKIMEAGGVELRLQSSKVDSTRQKIEIINDKISNDRMLIKKLENEIKKHTRILESSEIELKTSEDELTAFRGQLELVTEELNDISKQVELLNEQKEAKEDEREKVKIQMEEWMLQINEFRSKEIDIENKLEKVNGFIKRTKHGIKTNEEELKSLIVRDVSEYIGWLEESERKQYDGAAIDYLPEDELALLDMDSINQEISELEDYMKNVKVDIEILKEYGAKKAEYEERRDDLNVAVQERNDLSEFCENLKKRRLDEFMEGFNTISTSLKEMYQMITMGGNAELELVDSLDPFSEGILFSVMPPKKSWRNISNLSGGEKTLSSLALVFALHKYKPTPLYVMDEIDAALDFRNVSIVANYIKERTKNAQFVVISLRNNMFELAQQLVGIYKVNNMTKSVSLKNKSFLENV